MEGLNRITDRIAIDAEQEAAELLTHAREDSHRIHLHYQKAAEEKREHLLSLGRSLALEQVHRMTSVAELDARKTILAVKQELVSEVFADAKEKVTVIPYEEYQEFLIRLAVNACLTGTEEILLNQTDRMNHGPNLTAEVNERLARAGKTSSLSLSPDTRPISGGLILKDGPIETDCSLEVLIKQAKNRLTGEVAKILFDS